MILIRYIFFILIPFSVSHTIADDRNDQLDELFKELKIRNINLAYKAEKKIWNIWSTHPTDEKLTLVLEKGSRLVRDQKLFKAIDIFTDVIEIDPTWAEAWNKRATIYYMVGEFQKSQDDIDKVLELEVRHFGALAGQGMVNIQLKNYEKAILSYKKAQEIYPSIQSAEIMIKKIENLIKQELI